MERKLGHIQWDTRITDPVIALDNVELVKWFIRMSLIDPRNTLKVDKTQMIPQAT